MTIVGQTLIEELELLQTGELSARELVERSLAAAEKAEDEFTHIRAAEALNEAETIDKRRAEGNELPALAGIPFIVKDNICTRGIETSAGSAILAGFVPPYNATAYERLLAAGAILIGKTKMREFELDFPNEEQLHNDAGARALAAGAGLLALATDSGGSARLGAAAAGLTALKPSYGAVSRYGLIATASSFDAITPITRSADDAALILSLLAGGDERDAMTNKEYRYEYNAELEPGLAEMKIGIVKDLFVSADSALTIEQIKDNLAAATTEECELPGTTFAPAAHRIITAAEASSNLARYDGVRFGHRAPAVDLEELYRKTREEGFARAVKEEILFGTYVLSTGHYEEYYLRALKVRREIKKAFEEAFAVYDALILPANDSSSKLANLAGLPSYALSLNGRAVQIIGPAFSEEKVLRTAKALEMGKGASR